jgi:phage FluMu protein Com
MPVRFRCSYCNQLLGISRRKIGLPVKCPTCQGQVIVPPKDTEEKDAPEQPKQVIAPARQFEQSDFLQMLQQPMTAPAAPAASVQPLAPERVPEFPLAAPQHEPDVDVELLPQMPAAAGGLVMTPMKLTALAAVVIIALALAFAAGVVVGKLLSAPADKASSSQESAE